MSSFTQSKNYGTATYPILASDTSGLMKRCEAVLTPEKLKSRYLKGIPLKFPNGDEYSPDDLKDQINLAMNDVELLLGVTITRESFKEKKEFDWQLYKSFLHLKTIHRPILSLESLRIVSSDNQNIFEIPIQWIDASLFYRGEIHIIPLLAAFGATSTVGSPITVTNQAAGIAFLATLQAGGSVSNVPSYWEIQFTSGLSNTEGQVPVPVNQLIGCVAAINVLSPLAATNIHNSVSLQQDGVSQSTSGPGVQIYAQRIKELTEQRDEIVRKMKHLFSTKYHIGNV
jgi:hypothetical protein